MDDLRVAPGITIAADELMWRFGPTGGPGGQHANRSNTRAELGYDVAGSAALTETERARVVESLGDRLVDGVVWVSADESRSQWRNRQAARRRLAGLLFDAIRPPAAPRMRTEPSRAAKRRRIERKRRRGDLKRSRRPPETDE
ncbi:MAG TPA: alternative ribosome rescue aminoacyl-tRNA hydrolase ArfB [Acidimicrobiia bacterium]